MSLYCGVGLDWIAADDLGERSGLLIWLFVQDTIGGRYQPLELEIGPQGVLVP